MNRDVNREKLVGFLDTIRRPNFPIESIADRDSLIGSGLIDSLATLEIILFLETEFGFDFGCEGLDPMALDSIEGILDMIDRRSNGP